MVWFIVQELFDLTSSRMEQIIQENKVVEWLEEFFTLNPTETHTIILGMGNGGANYGARIYYPDGSQEMYAILGVWQTDDRGLPQFEYEDKPQLKIEILSTIIHEFIHSYANPLVDKHEAELKNSGEKLFQIVAAQMSRQAYGSWKTMMYETLVRACTICYLMDVLGEKYAQEHLERESKKLYFLWLEELVPLLQEYKVRRETYPNLDAFFPCISAFFDDYAENIDQIRSKLNYLLEQARKDWEAKAPKVMGVDPPNGSQDVDPDRKTITITFDRPMYKGNWGFRPGPKTPKDDEKEATWDASGKVHTLYVQLEPDQEYEFWLNEEDFLLYMSTESVHLIPYKISFRTRKEDVHFPSLTKEEMLEDFDLLVAIVRDVFPATTANKKVYGLDVFSRLQAYRQSITGRETAVEFARLLANAISSCKGSHFWHAKLTASILVLSDCHSTLFLYELTTLSTITAIT